MMVFGDVPATRNCMIVRVLGPKPGVVGTAWFLFPTNQSKIGAPPGNGDPATL